MNDEIGYDSKVVLTIPNLPVARLIHDLLNPIATVKANLAFIAQSVSGEVREAAVIAHDLATRDTNHGILRALRTICYRQVPQEVRYQCD